MVSARTAGEGPRWGGSRYTMQGLLDNQLGKQGVMKRKLTEYLVCPNGSGDLDLDEPRRPASPGADIEQGRLDRQSCGASSSIVPSMPRFVSGEKCAPPFGFQWNKFPTLQVELCQ
jgi:uncharacterized protein YbaR (Trm112 family)